MLGTDPRFVMRLPWPRPRNPMVIATHHKVGTVLMSQVFKRTAALLGWSSEVVFGHRLARAPVADVTLFGHGTPQQLPEDSGLRAIHLVRDPREVLISGYLYHLHTGEQWCVEVPPSIPPDSVVFPLVPYCQEDRNRAWKVEYLASLRGRSYQENLRSLDTTSGLLFELEHYAHWTIEEMAAWASLDDDRVLVVRFEDLMASFDESFDRISRHLGLRAPERRLLALVARQHDLGRKGTEELRSMTHVHGPAPGRWKQYLTDDITDRLDATCGEAIRALGYGVGEAR